MGFPYLMCALVFLALTLKKKQKTRASCRLVHPSALSSSHTQHAYTYLQMYHFKERKNVGDYYREVEAARAAESS